MPDALTQATDTTGLYVSTGGTDCPVVKQEQVGHDGDRTLWRIDVQGRTSHQFGEEGTRESVETIAAAVDSRTGFSSFRPEWSDLLYTPPVIGGPQQPTLERLKGQPVKPLYVFGNDDRQVFYPNAWPWRCVGKVFNSLGKAGTGVLVNGNLMVTAGHLAPWGQSSWWMRFIPAYWDGASVYGLESYVSHYKGYNPSGSVTGYDYVICRLYNPVGNTLGWFGFNGYSSDWEDHPYWTLVGYPGAVAGGQRPSWQGSVSAFDDDSDSYGGLEIESRADASPGNSGGPLFGWWGNDPRVVGVISGEEEDYIFPASYEKGNVAAGGSGFTNLISWGRANW